eukprot:210199-Prorocentrum_lima.AAC.1
MRSLAEASYPASFGIVDMCRQGAVEEEGNKVRKRTAIRKRVGFKMKATARRCLCAAPYGIL